MSERHRMGQDGILEDGVTARAASSTDLKTYDDATTRLSQMRAPTMLTANGSGDRLFVACFDGTWNDMVHDPEHKTNVALIREQLTSAALRDPRIAAGYETGIGTVGNRAEKVLDGAIGYTYDERLEAMYTRFVKQANEWIREDPNARIRLAGLGFSRGAEEAAGFSRMVAERGIPDLSSAVERRGADGRTHVEYTKPALVEPGQIPQALALIDPVGTGHPRDHDRRPPPSVISGLQLVARDERRNLFQSTSILDPGMSADGRFLSMTVAGAHSDLGGGYHRDGLSARGFNLVSDYLNGLSETPILNKLAVPTNPQMSVIHRSEEGSWFYRTSVFERTAERGRVEALAPRAATNDRFNAEPRDEAMASRFDFRPVPIGAVPGDTASVVSRTPPQPPTPSIDTLSPRDAELHRQARAGVQRLDASMGRAPDEASERVAAALLPAAREAGLGGIDHVVRSQNGRTLFAVEGALSSPTNRMALVDARTAVATPVETSLRALDTLNAEMQRRSAEQAQTQAPTQPTPSRAMHAH